MGDKSSVAAVSSPMEVGSRDNRNEDENGKMSSMRNAETLFRLLPVALSLASLVIMFKNSQSNDFGSLSYSDLGAFRYLVHANGICAGYSLLSAIYAALPRPSILPRAWTLFIFDQVLTYAILAAGAASTEVVYLAYKGDEAVTWSDACSSFSGFCHKATASVAITFVCVICYGLLSLVSSYRLFSNYDAPVGYVHKGIEIAAFQA
ncbi:Casparian strip membrane protein domain [Dillenia turbinata]|uniref:CASP-like protein n=1 Tax=Dillenia turbinata TaxID=194707 RepID=A0AAN8Z9B8_9MAGN